MSKETEKPPRITKIWAANFRSIEKLDLELSPLTVLVGPNAAGKSNIADIPLFISDALRNGLDNALSVRGRAGVQHGRGSIVSGATIEAQEAQVCYEFAVRLNHNSEHKVQHETVSVAQWHEDAPPTKIEVRNGRLTHPSVSRMPPQIREMLKHDKDAFYAEFLKINPTALGMPFPLVTLILSNWEPGVPNQLRHDKWARTAFPIHAAAQQLEGVRSYHIFPNTLRDPQLYSPRHPLAENGGNLASVIQEMSQKQSEGFGELVAVLSKIVPSITGIAVKPAGRHLTINFTHRGAGSGKKVVLDAFQESDGTLRLLGLLTALYQKPAPSLSIIEEPELAIHPGAMAYIAELMEETAHLRMPILITTHSPDFLDLVQAECIRAVEPGEGGTIVAPIASHQREALAKKLFTPGELHRMEGLQITRKYV